MLLITVLLFLSKESLRTLGEAKNKTLEALRTEKKTLNARLNEEEAKVEELRSEIALLRKTPSSDKVVQMLHRGAVQSYHEGNPFYID